MSERRLRAPWRVVEHSESFDVQDATGSIHLAYVYFEDEAGRRRDTKRLTKDEARRVAAHIARIPEYAASAKQNGPDTPDQEVT